MEVDDDSKVVLWIGHTRGANTDALKSLANKGNLIALGSAPIASFMNLIGVSTNGRGRTAQEIYDNVREMLDRTT